MRKGNVTVKKESKTSEVIRVRGKRDESRDQFECWKKKSVKNRAVRSK